VSESVIGSGRIRTENSAQERDNLCIAETGATFSVLSDPTFSGTTVPAPSRNFKGEIPVNFLDDSLFPENQEKLVITAAPYGPEWEPADFPEDIPLTMDQHVQQAVDCWEAGATVLHIHVRELDGKGSKRLSQFNELLRRLREAVPEMILQVGGSISFAPESEDGDAKWLSDDTRHMLAELDPKPDQVTIAINSSQMNIVELMTDSDIAGTSFQRPELYEAYRNMEVPASPEWVEEHLRRLTANGIQPHFQLAHSAQLETVERLVRRGVYTGPLNITWVAIGGGFDGPSPYTMMEFIRRVPDGASLTLESIMRNVLPINTMALAMGLHTRCGNEDTLWGRLGEKCTSADAVRQLVRIAGELGREVATGKEAREIYQLDEYWGSADEALAKLGYAPNRRPGQRGFTQHA
jgi:uncharacterized protein (DUF849 family)